MKYFLDTEFIECEKQRTFLGFKMGAPIPTIDLISIALVAEDGREFYALNSECELDYAWKNEWVRENVLLPIWEQYAPSAMRHHSVNYFSPQGIKRIFKEHGQTKGMLSWGLLTFVHAAAYEKHVGTMDSFFEAPFEDKHEFLGYYADYDWVVFCQLFGRMIDLPKGFPMYCTDLQQYFADLGQPVSLKPKQQGEHHALNDARWNKELYLAMRPLLAAR